MSWFRDLFLGLFTRHITTKFLALLLSIGLFVFVQASLTGTQEVTRLELVPSLAEDIRDQYVLLLTNNYGVTGLTIRGELSKVEPMARLYRNNNLLRFPVDLRILTAYGRPKADDPRVIEIPIDANLFRDEVLFGKDVTVERLDTGKSVLISKAEERTVRVEVAPELQSLAHDDYEGRLTFAVNKSSVLVRGPSNAFDKEKAPRIVVTVKGIGDRISANPIPGETGTLSFGDGLCDIKWKDGGINPASVPFLRITPEGDDPMPPNEFRQAIAVSCTATKRKDQIRLENVPIEVLYPLPRTFDLVADYQPFPPFTDKALSDGSMQLLDVRLPRVLATDEDFLKNLVVVLDVAAAEEGEKGVLKVPFYLDLENRTREEDVAKLRQVAIVREATHTEFRRKP